MSTCRDCACRPGTDPCEVCGEALAVAAHFAVTAQFTHAYAPEPCACFCHGPQLPEDVPAYEDEAAQRLVTHADDCINPRGTCDDCNAVIAHDRLHTVFDDACAMCRVEMSVADYPPREA